MKRTIALSAVAVMAMSGIGVGIAAAAPTSASSHSRAVAQAREPVGASGHRPKRPASEHVPTSLHHVHLVRRDRPVGHATKNRTVTGKQATRLVRSFDAMKTQPKNYFHCDVAGGPEDIVTFRTAKHTWVVKESICTNVVVTRDGKPLPTLLANVGWEKAVAHDLGH